ncbi:MAG: zinc-ribbon domain-containing protein, partial [Caldilineaceae bacterium]
GRVQQKGVYEMVLDCQFCGAKGLPARTHQHCPNCGAPQETASRRFPSDAEKKAVANYQYKGASLICPACNTVNDGDAKFCRQCGAPLENATRAQTVAAQERVAGAAFAAGDERNVQQEELDADLKKSTPPVKKGGVPWVLIAIVGIVAVVIIGVLVALFWRRDVPAQVSELNWERVVFVEEYRAVPDGTWCDSMPFDAYSVSRSQRQRSTNRIPDGETCTTRRVDQGDGTFREEEVCTTNYREEPVYDDYCSYLVNRWIRAREATASGVLGQREPAWPNANLRGGSGLGAEREGGRDADYRVVLTSDGDAFTCAVDESLWRTIKVGASYNLPVGVITGSPDCSALNP